MAGKIIAVCVSDEKGTQKHSIDVAVLKPDHGIEGDAHAGSWHRQVSLLADEAIETMRAQGLALTYGNFGENIVTQGIDLRELGVGTMLKLGSTVTGEITQIGKVCHDRCAIYFQTGDCIMPREGLFLRILTEGTVSVGDEIEVLHKVPRTT